MLEYFSYVVWGYMGFGLFYSYWVDKFGVPVRVREMVGYYFTPSLLVVALMYYAYVIGGKYDLLRVLLLCPIIAPLLYILLVYADALVREHEKNILGD